MAFDEHVINITLLSSNIQPEIINDLSIIATKIALQNFEWRFITFVFFNSTWFSQYTAEFFLQSYEKAVIVGKGKFYPLLVEKTRQYVLFESSVTSIVHTLEWMRKYEFDNTGKYLIICHSLDMHECDEVSAMQALWEYKITNVVLLKSVENVATGFTYFPLNNSSCIYDSPVRLENLTFCLNAIDFKESCNLFPIKLSNLHACPLTVSTFLQQPNMDIKNGIPSGSDGDLLCLIAEKLNVNISVMTPVIGEGWGKLEPNGTWSGSLADVYYDYANFSMTSAALTLARFSAFHLSAEYNSASVVWITHPPKKVPSSLKLAYPFQENARIALVVSFVIVIICSLVFQTRFYYRLSRKLKLEKPRSSVVFYSWMICMGLGIPRKRLPTNTGLLQIVLLWIWFCILMRTFYQVSLISAMKSIYYYEEFETVDDAIDLEYKLGGGAALKDYYIDYPIVYTHWKDVETSDIVPTLRNLSQGIEFVLAMSEQTARTVICKENIHVHILQQKVVTSPTVIFFKKYSPLADAVNSVLKRVTESGFTEMFYKKYAPIGQHQTEDSIETIKLKHYSGCYAVLITGWITSIMLFVAEILFVKICGKHSAL